MDKFDIYNNETGRKVFTQWCAECSWYEIHADGADLHRDRVTDNGDNCNACFARD